MKNKFILFLLLAGIAVAQQGINGRYYPTIGTVAPAIYGSFHCGATSASATSLQCSIGPVPAGSAIIGSLDLANTTSTLTGVYNGTGTNQTTGSDTFSNEPVYKNSLTGGTFESYVFYLCSSQAFSNFTAVWTGSAGPYIQGIVVYGAPSSGCADGYNKGQGSNSCASPCYNTSGTVTPTGGNDILVGLMTNFTGGTLTCTTTTNCGDGQGNTYTLQNNTSGVVAITTLQETSSQAYYAKIQGVTNAAWNMEAIAIKSGVTNGVAVNYGSNGKNYIQAQGGNGKFYGGANSASCLIDMSGGTSGGTPTQTTLFNSVRGNSTCVGVSSNVTITGMGAGTTYTTAQQPVTLFSPAIVGGVGYGGNSGLWVGGVTTSGGGNIGDIVFNNLPGSSPNVVGFTIYEDCPGNVGQDCGALVGAFGGGQYAGPHYQQHGSSPGLTLAMENEDGGTVTYNPIASSKVLNFNVQLNETGNNYMIVCDASNNMIYSYSMPASGSAYIASFNPLLTGEEPATAGYHYYEGNIRLIPTSTFNFNGPCY